jgi:CubicO group peptidase (beta-lactamase class C family)
MSLTRREFICATGSGLAAASLTGSRYAQAASAGGAPSSTFGERIAALDRRIRQSMKDSHVPGVSIAIIRDAGVVWQRGLGVRDVSTGAPVDVDTVFSAQSMSKPVFAYRVMKLSEQGVLDLDAPLTRYTPNRFVENDPRLEGITARRVLSHTTGLPNWRSPEEPLRINFTPGSKWSYSGEGYHYLQSVVTRLTGHTDPKRCGVFEMNYRVCATDFGDYMGATVLKPFSMKHSGYVWTPAMQRNVTRPHDPAGAPLPQKPSTAIDVARYGSAGSLMTTAGDYAQFLIEVMKPKPADGYRLSEATRREMLSPQVEAVGSPIKTSWALGWQIWHLEKGELIAHGGDDEGWHSLSLWSPERRTGFVILTNGEGGYKLIWEDLLKPLIEEFVLQ